MEAAVDKPLVFLVSERRGIGVPCGGTNRCATEIPSTWSKGS